MLSLPQTDQPTGMFVRLGTARTRLGFTGPTRLGRHDAVRLLTVEAVHPGAIVADRRTGKDDLPELVHAFVESERAGDGLQGGEAGIELLGRFERHVRHMSRTYPDAWFTNARKNDEAVLDLAHRSFTSCARVQKGRFPFQGRTPFTAYLEERFDGRTVRYHSFYAKLSIAREIMRDDYARNLSRDPVLRWRADLYREIRALLRAEAEEVPQGRGLPPRWQLRSPGIRAMRPLGAIEAKLIRDGERDVRAIVFTALRMAGPLTCSRITNLAEAVLGTPEEDEPVAPILPATAGIQVGIRRAVLAAWTDLEEDDQLLLAAIARGEAYDSLVERCPRFRHKVAVTRAVTRCGKHFMARIAGEAGLEDDALPSGLRPKDLIELVLEVLVEVIPDAVDAPDGEAR
jgi:hypothetical protein